MKNFLWLFLFMTACHAALDNRHDSLAIQCALSEQTDARVLLKFTGPGGLELSAEQLDQLQVQYLDAGGKPQSLAPSPKACISVPIAPGRVKAQIRGEAPLLGEAVVVGETGTIHKVELETPGYLELELRCPKAGLLAAATLGEVLALKKATGKLSGYAIQFSVYDRDGNKMRDLLTKGAEDIALSVPKSFDLRDLAEGSYRLGLTVTDGYHGDGETSSQSQCGLIVRRTCATDEDFDAETISCVPKLCDNAYRVGAKWEAGLALDRGVGQYECRLVDGGAVKTLLSHSCSSGYFKGSDSCLSVRKIESTCALLENNQVSCWGTQPAKNIYSSDPKSRRDINFQATFDFGEEVEDMYDWCVLTATKKIHCWQYELTENPHYFYLPVSGNTWKAYFPPGFSAHNRFCGIRLGEFWCGVDASGQGGTQIKLPKEIIAFDGTCLVDVEGGVWCEKQYTPRQSSDSEGYDGYYRVSEVPGKAKAVVTLPSLTACVLLQEGKIACWGNNVTGVLGTNSSARRSSEPNFVVDSQGLPLNEVTELTSGADTNGGYFVCARQQEGKVFCWGTNLEGQIANGTPGEDDEGDPLFSRFAVSPTVTLQKPLLPQQ